MYLKKSLRTNMHARKETTIAELGIVVSMHL